MSKRKIENASLLLIQLETPIETESMLHHRCIKKIKFVLNPAPAAKVE
jgi:hypothetical protein